MMDRMHNYGGTHFNRGLFRDHIREMSPEHEIDLLTYSFTLMDDYQFEMEDHAYRLSMGSLNATEFAIENSMKSRVDLSERSELKVEAFQAENLRAQRILFHLSYQYNISGKHHAGFRHTLTGYKSDLDATFFYTYGDFKNGMIQAEISFLDWGSNVTQSLAADSRNEYNDHYPVTHQYEQIPQLYSLNLVSPEYQGFKAELLGGIQSIVHKEVYQAVDSTTFLDKEWAHYAGALIEYNGPHVTVGLTYQRTFSKLRRKPAPGSDYDLDFKNRQIFNNVTAYASGRVRNFRLEQWLSYGYNFDALEGASVPNDVAVNGNPKLPFDYEEKPLMLKSRVLYDRLEPGFKGGLEFHAEFTHPQEEAGSNGIKEFDFRRVLSIIKDENMRLTATFGYRFTTNLYVIAGLSYDLDKDKQSGYGGTKETGTPTWFDGGFGRIMFSW